MLEPPQWRRFPRAAFQSVAELFAALVPDAQGGFSFSRASLPATVVANGGGDVFFAAYFFAQIADPFRRLVFAKTRFDDAGI